MFWNGLSAMETPTRPITRFSIVRGLKCFGCRIGNTYTAPGEASCRSCQRSGWSAGATGTVLTALACPSVFGLRTVIHRLLQSMSVHRSSRGSDGQRSPAYLAMPTKALHSAEGHPAMILSASSTVMYLDRAGLTWLPGFRSPKGLEARACREHPSLDARPDLLQCVDQAVMAVTPVTASISGRKLVELDDRLGRLRDGDEFQTFDRAEPFEFTVEEHGVEPKLGCGFRDFVRRPLAASGLHVTNDQRSILALIDVIDPSLDRWDGLVDISSGDILDADAGALDVRLGARQVRHQHACGECIEGFQTFPFAEP